ncbi:aspartate--tRNA(Asn) ligase [Microcoleus sp. CZ3-B4]|uniref:aspartate--tRNA(Asn) ligase n=1 Tax=Microcoleus sp. CZ3-B4 TaxID=2818733 RepID=UPI002FCF7DB0
MTTKVSLLPSVLMSHINEEVFLHGWIHSYRKMGGIAFLVIRDGCGTVQVVIETPELLEISEDLIRESIVEVTGFLVSQPNVKQGVEVQARAINVLVKSETLPIEIDRQKIFNKIDLDVLLKHRSCSLRNLRTRAVFKIQSVLGKAFREFLDSQSFVEIHSPKIVKMGAEGGSEVFSLKYFEQSAYLTQSPQLYKQIMVGVFEKVYEIGPVYRAEEHNTSRHLNEYISMDVEFGFINSEQDIIDLHQALLKYVFGYVQDQCEPELNELNVIVPQSQNAFPQITLEEAVKVVKDEYKYVCTKPGDLDPEAERLICRYAQEKYGVDVIYITSYPVKKRPFYTMPNSEKPELTKSFDVLFRGLEITTGGQRIHEYSHLISNLDKFGYKADDFEGYLECFKFGMPPHGGFGMGLERLTKQLCNLDNVRLATLFPRDRNRIIP